MVRAIDAMDTSDPASDAMIQALVAYGCDPTEAKDRVHSMLNRAPVKFMEVYGRGSINHCANHSRRNLGLKGVGALDLRTTKAHGSP